MTQALWYLFLKFVESKSNNLNYTINFWTITSKKNRFILYEFYICIKSNFNLNDKENNFKIFIIFLIYIVLLNNYILIV